MTGLMTPNKEQITGFYKTALQRSLDAYAKLDDKEWDKKASDQGTAKDHLAQLVGTMEAESIPVTKAAIDGLAPSIPGFDKRSDVIPFRVAAAKAVSRLSALELQARMKAAFEQHIAMLDALSDADLDKPATSPAWDRPGTIRDLFFGAYLFLPGQYQEIRRVNKKKLPHWIEDSSPDQVNYHMGRLFNYMPLIFRSDKAGDLKATYLFTMEGEGAGPRVGVVRGRDRADHFHELHQGDGIEEVKSHEAIGAPGRRGHGDNSEARGVRGEDGARPAQPVELLPEGVLELEIFGDRFDDDVAAQSARFVAEEIGCAAAAAAAYTLAGSARLGLHSE